MREFLVTLLICSISTSCIAGIMILMLPLIRRRYLAKTRYYAWLIVIIGMLIPFRLPSDTSLVQVSAPTDKMIVIREPAKNTKKSFASIQGIATSENRQTEPVTKGKAINISSIAFFIWFSVACCILIYQFIRHFRFIHLVNRWSSEPQNVQTLRSMDMALQKKNIRKNIKLRISSFITTPMLIGIIHPTVLLPQEEYKNFELSFILEHELTHYKRKDLWYKVLIIVTGAVHWFNPFFLIIRKQIERECEISCDEVVLANADSETRLRYTETIVGIIRRNMQMRSAISTTFDGGKKGMKKRLEAIMDNNKRKLGVVILAVLLVCIMGTGVIIAVSENNQKLIPWSSFANVRGTRTTVIEDNPYDIAAMPEEAYENLSTDEYEKVIEDSYVVTSIENVVIGTIPALENSIETEGSVYSFWCTVKDESGKDFDVYAEISYQYQIKDKNETQEQREILDSFHSSIIKMFEDESYETLVQEEKEQRMLKKLEVYVKDNIDNRIAFYNVKIDTISINGEIILQTWTVPNFANEEEEIRWNANQLGYKYLKVNINEGQATDRIMTDIFKKNNLTWEDKVWVEFKDGTYTLYEPTETVYFSPSCGWSSESGEYYVKVSVKGEILAEMSEKELDKKREGSSDIIFEVLNRKAFSDLEDLKSEISSELSVRLGIDEEYFVIVAEKIK